MVKMEKTKKEMRKGKRVRPKKGGRMIESKHEAEAKMEINEQAYSL